MVRRLHPLLILALSGCAAAAPPAAPSPPAAPRCLSVVAWNDLHGQLGADAVVIDTGRVRAGGVIALADQLEALRATGDAVVVLDAGDLFTGPMASTFAEGAPVIEAYRILGVDAAALGNHDFDFGPVGHDKVTARPGLGDEAGPDGPRGALLDLMAKASFPFVSANVTKKGGAPTGWRGLESAVVIERSGFRVGVVGYTAEDTPSTTLAPNVADLDFGAGAAARVARAIRGLRERGAAPVVLLAHAGIEGDLPLDLADDRPRRGELARLVAGLGADRPDVIIGGHRHGWMKGRVGGVPTVTSDQHGVGLGRARFCPAGGALRLEGIEHRTAMASDPPVSELGRRVAAAVAPWEERVRAIAEEPVTALPRACSAPAPGGSAFADQVARAAAQRIADAAAPPAGVPVVGLVNIGSLRAPIGPGPVRYRDVFAVAPFENTVAACGTTRAGLRRFVENGLRKDWARDRFPLGVSGAKIRVARGADRSVTLRAIEIDGQPAAASDDAPVWLAITDFMLFGGDDLLAGVPCKPAVTSQTRIRDAWRDVLARERACDGPSRSVVVE